MVSDGEFLKDELNFKPNRISISENWLINYDILLDLTCKKLNHSEHLEIKIRRQKETFGNYVKRNSHVQCAFDISEYKVDLQTRARDLYNFYKTKSRGKMLYI